jgi:hypothetical protein
MRELKRLDCISAQGAFEEVCNSSDSWVCGFLGKSFLADPGRESGCYPKQFPKRRGVKENAVVATGDEKDIMASEI